MTSLTEVLKKIERDIVQVLSEAQGEALTQEQLFLRTHLLHTAEYGWSFAIENLEKAKKIKVVGTIYKGELLYQLV